MRQIQIKCWGYNGDGQLGDGTTTDRSEPTEISGNETYSSLPDTSGSPKHMCAFTTSGVLHCWGNNTYGQIGDGATDNVTTPTEISF